MQADFVLIALVAVLAPLLGRLLAPWVRIPVVVFELVLGIIVGPAVLGWVHPDDFLHTLSQFGLAMLFFVAGTEMSIRSLGGRTGSRAIVGWFISIAAGIALGFIVAPGEAAIIIGIALASTALGTLLPILRDAGELDTPFGRTIGALGAVGEFGPLIAISIFLGSRKPGAATIVLLIYLIIAAAAVVWAFKAPQGRLHQFVAATLHTSGQFAVRVVLLILIALVTLSVVFGIDMLLGAFTAGLVWRMMMRDAGHADREVVESKIEAIAFGFLVPIFFVYTGVTFDLQSLLQNPVLLALVPVALVALFVVRGLPSMLAAPPGSRARDRLSVALMGATGLPIIVAVTSIGTEHKLIPASSASVLVGAGMLSVLLFPIIAMALRGEQVTSLPVDDSV